MKKLLVFTMLILFAVIFNDVFAQQKQRVEPIKRNTTATTKSSDALIPQGAAMIGGAVSFVSTIQDSENSYIFTLAPVAGYFVIDNLALGTSIELMKIKDVDPIFGFGPFVRYYLNMGLFVQGKFQFQSQPGILDERVTGFAAGPAIGYAAFLNNHVSIEPMVYYNRHFGDLGEFNEIGLQIGVNAYLGR